MPVCLGCGVGYLDSEVHQCSPKMRTAKITFGVLAMFSFLTRGEKAFIGGVATIAATVTGAMLWGAKLWQTDPPAVLSLLIMPGWMLMYPVFGLLGGVHGDYAGILIPICAMAGNAFLYGLVAVGIVKARHRTGRSRGGSLSKG